MRVVVLHETEELEGYLAEFDRDWFTTVVGRRTIHGRRALVLIAFDDELTYLGLLEKAGQVATLTDRVKCSRLTAIDPALPLEELREALSTGVRRHFGYGQLPDGTSRHTIAALERLRPDLAGVIRELSARPQRSAAGPGSAVVAMEKDAVGIALDLAGIERDLAVGPPGGARTPGPFLAGLPGAVLREDQIIAHDLGVFGAWQVVQRSAVGAVEFASGDRSLTVVNVNRTPVERALGVDLIYYNEHFHAFVLVQYKRMTQERTTGWLYRPDGNHAAEVERMQRVPDDPADHLDALNYRLNPQACYFKLCESVVLDPLTSDLLRGMYVPLDYLGACAASAKGTRGGEAYGYSTLPRHLNNTQFVQLVQDGWIGSAGAVSDDLRAFVEARVQDGRSVMLAVGRRPPRRSLRR